jgi:pimeloyl-ACP methyl ester carboxylesterase
MGDAFDVVVRGHRLRAERFGSPTAATLVVGLHGLSLNLRCFDVIGAGIGGEELQLIALDLRGRGRSEVTPAGTYGWDEHALDVFAVADVLGFDRFGMIGQSMGGSVAMKAAELDGARLDGVVLVDIAGRVDRGVGELIGSVMAGVADEHDSIEHHLEAVRSQGLIDDDEWKAHWEGVYRYGAEERGGRVPQRVDPTALAEDRAYGASQAALVYERWKHLTMPTLLLRATREFEAGVGFVVPADDRDAFVRDVPRASVVEVDANHLTITAHAGTAAAISSFFASLRKS